MQHNIFKLGCHLHTGGKGVGWGVGGEGWGVEGFGGIVKLSSLSLVSPSGAPGTLDLTLECWR